MPNVGGELEGDSTGIYLCFEYGRLINLKLDEFNGIVEELAYTYLEW